MDRKPVQPDRSRRLEELEEENLKLRAELRQTLDLHQELQERSRHLEDLLLHAQDFAVYRLAVADDNPLNFRPVVLSPSFFEILGVDPGETPQMVWEIIHPDDLPRIKKAHLEAFTSHRFDQTFRIFHPVKKEWRWIHQLTTGRLNHKGRHDFVNGVMQDVTQRLEAEQELAVYREHLEELVARRTAELDQANQSLAAEVAAKEKKERALRAALAERELLLREVHHRVKNNLQSIASLLDLQALSAPQDVVTEAFVDCRDRVRAMCMVHQHLYQSRDLAQVELGPYLQSLFDHLLKAHGAGAMGIVAELDVDGLRLDMDRAIACGLLFNELLSNALKHGYPQGGPGRIRLSGGPTAEGQSFVFSDDGVGLPPGFDAAHSPSLGMRLVVSLVEGQLGGRLTLGPGPGTCFRVSLPQALPAPGEGAAATLC